MTRRSRTAAAIALTSLLGLGATACAARTYPYGGGYDRVDARRAYNVGYRDGYDAGRQDARHHERYDPIGSGRYRDVDRDRDHDRDDRHGRRDDYARAYREAFRQGYDEGYRSVGWRGR